MFLCLTLARSNAATPAGWTLLSLGACPRLLSTSIEKTLTQDSFQQHDVQELCRVLFDALESTFQGTVNEKLVNNLYQGER